MTLFAQKLPLAFRRAGVALFGCAVLLAIAGRPVVARAAATTAAPVAAGAPAGPWEPDELDRPAPAPQLAVSRTIALGLIHWYQRDLSTRSVSRCPFTISCSRFAERAIARHGVLVGTLLFIDRNLYRENPGMGTLYPVVQAPDGALRLDDGFFLGSGTP